MSLTEVVQLLATLMLTGIVWYVQVIHYPLFARVGEEQLVRYCRESVDRSSYLLLPLLSLEAVGASISVWCGMGWMNALAALLLLPVWGVTWFTMLPLHKQLCFSPQESTIRDLLRWNWVRVIFWSLRSAILLGALW